MTKRIGILWSILATISFIFWVFRGWDVVSGILACLCLLIYYGENILNRLEK